MLQAMIIHEFVDGSMITRLQDVVDNKPVKAVPPPPTASWPSNPSTGYYPPPPAAAAPPPSQPPAVPPNTGLDPQQQVQFFCYHPYLFKLKLL